MNIIENAIERLNDLKRYCDILHSPEEYFKHMQGHITELSMVLSVFDISEMKNVIVKSLEKQNPRKVKEIKEESIATNYECPHCNHLLGHNYKPYTEQVYLYCELCGQKLEW